MMKRNLTSALFVGLLWTGLVIPSVQAQNGHFPFSDDWDPEEDMRQMQEEMEMLLGKGRIFQGGFSNMQQTAGSGLNLSQSETESQYVITINTGDDNAKVDINLKGNVLSLSMLTQSQSGTGGVTAQSMQTVSQSFTLPDDADPATVNTFRQKGKVVVTIDKMTSDNSSQQSSPPTKKVDTL